MLLELAIGKGSEATELGLDSLVLLLLPWAESLHTSNCKMELRVLAALLPSKRKGRATGR